MRALVTGGSGALGRATCVALAARGHSVAVGWHTQAARAGEVASEIGRAGGAALPVHLDVTDAASTERAVAEAARALGGLDVLVHAAAVNADGLIADLDPADVSTMFAVHVTGAMVVCRAALPWLLESGRGRIVLFSSVLASRSNTGVAGYASAKGAVEALTRSLAVELGPKRITVNAVAPGYISAGLGLAPLAAAGRNVRALVPARRAGTPEEVAAVVAFLASDAASYVNGSILPVDGGLLAGARLQADSPDLAGAGRA